MERLALYTRCTMGGARHYSGDRSFSSRLQGSNPPLTIPSHWAA